MASKIQERIYAEKAATLLGANWVLVDMESPDFEVQTSTEKFDLEIRHKYDDAVAAYREAVKLNPNSPYVWYWLGEAYVELGKRAEALDALDHLRKIDPSPLDPSRASSLADSLSRLLSVPAAPSQ